MKILEAPKPSQRPGVTASEWLYEQYLSAKRKRNSQRMTAARHSLVLICRRACGHIRPFWTPPTPTAGAAQGYEYTRFYRDARKDRLQFADIFVRKELRRGMTMKDARFIGRRCKLRLIDEVRSITGHRRKSSDEFRQALDKVRHFPGDKLWYAIRQAESWREATNASIARDWHRSEGLIRKQRKRLAAWLWSIAESEGQRNALVTLRLAPDGKVMTRS